MRTSKCRIEFVLNARFTDFDDDEFQEAAPSRTSKRPRKQTSMLDYSTNNGDSSDEDANLSAESVILRAFCHHSSSAG